MSDIDVITIAAETQTIDMALALAGLGLKVFPCTAKKVPLFASAHPEDDPLRGKCHGECGKLGHGFYDGTTDPISIMAWPDCAYIGIYCEGSGIFAVDIDVKNGKDGYASFDAMILEAGGQPLAIGPIQNTPSGGAHYIFKYPAGLRVPNNTDVLGVGLDLRSSGYICTGPGYTWQPDHGPDSALTEAPEWLLDLIRAMTEHKTQQQPEPVQPDDEPIQAGSQPDHPTPAHTGDKVDWAAGLLKRLSKSRCDDYHQWSLVGLALLELGGSGLSLWDEWSKKSPEKYEPGRCAKDWEYFKPGGTTLGSLYYWAEQDDPGGGKAPTTADLIPPEPEGPLYWEDPIWPGERAKPVTQAEPAQQPTTPTQGQPQAPRAARKTAWTVAELYATEFPEPMWAIPGYVPVGLINLAGRPKVGKSWLALQFAHAVATGGRVFGKPVPKGRVLYLALEDGPRRLKNRIAKQGIPQGADIDFRTEWKPMIDGGMSDLLNLIMTGGYTFVVIDTISRALGRSDQMDLSQMNVIMGNLQTFAQAQNVSILLIDHHRKSNGLAEGNPIDDIIGSSGKAGVADAIIGLYRQQGQPGATLKVVGREIEEVEITLEFDGLTGCWQYVGAAGDVRKDTVKGAILQAMADMTEAGHTLTAHSIAAWIGKKEPHIHRAMAELQASGKIRKMEKVGKEIPYALLTGEYIPF